MQIPSKIIYRNNQYLKLAKLVIPSEALSYLRWRQACSDHTYKQNLVSIHFLANVQLTLLSFFSKDLVSKPNGKAVKVLKLKGQKLSLTHVGKVTKYSDSEVKQTVRRRKINSQVLHVLVVSLVEALPLLVQCVLQAIDGDIDDHEHHLIFIMIQVMMIDDDPWW